MLKESLSFPLTSDHRLKTIGIGSALQFSVALITGIGVLFSVGVLALTALISLAIMAVFWGYYLRVLRHAANEEAVLPEFDDWRRLAVTGVKFLGIILGYMSIPIVLIFIEVGFLTTSSGAMTGAGAVVYMIARLLALIITFFLPVGLTNYVLTDRMREAFALREIFGAALTGSYVKSILLSFPILFCYNIVQSLGVFIGGLSMYVLYLAVSAVLSFYLLIVIFSLLGRGCGPHLREAKDEEETAG